ncbi:unnamed protein product [Anisakis simplex]|uniref:Histidine-rich membrane protein KE4 homolog 2 (inferred by orthology to a C. elegans protein) n=1 Tax=Anisakis simplex TaxID=6269 RepID=A0A0M3JSI2_ANISI|nr:unnamed protein product [Anisakis simplex]
MDRLCVLIVTLLASLAAFSCFDTFKVEAHSHADHNVEPAAYKYSREANEAAAWNKDNDHHHTHSHGEQQKHTHGIDHDHGHSHEESDFTHEGSTDSHHQHINVDLDPLHDLHDEHAHSHGGKYAPRIHDHSHGDAKKPGVSGGQLKNEYTYDPKGASLKSCAFLLIQALLAFYSYLRFMNDPYTRLWVHSIGSTIIISIAPFILLSVIPIQANTAENEPLLKVLLSFGSGGLLGDAFLHLIPHAQPASSDTHHSHSHSHSHGHEGHSHGPHDMSVGAYVLAGIIVFLTVEKLVRIFRGAGDAHGHSHSQAHSQKGHSRSRKGSKTIRNTNKAKKSDASSAEEATIQANNETFQNHFAKIDLDLIFQCILSLQSSCDESERKELIKHQSQTGFKVAAYLNMAADFTHNFTDGLAIGASYLAGTTVGLVTMITVLVHEVPHEIGDFAILVQSGFSKRRAMCVQLLTAVGAISGCVLSLLTADAQNITEAAAASWVLPFTAGGFIYIATVSVIPELLENSSPWQSVKEITALLTGIALMYMIAIFE